MEVIKQTPDEFIVELGITKLHWWQKVWSKIYDWWIDRHPWLG